MPFKLKDVVQTTAMPFQRGIITGIAKPYGCGLYEVAWMDTQGKATNKYNILEDHELESWPLVPVKVPPSKQVQTAVLQQLIDNLNNRLSKVDRKQLATLAETTFDCTLTV